MRGAGPANRAIGLRRRPWRGQGRSRKFSRGAHAKSIAIVIATIIVKPSTQASMPISPVRFVKRPAYEISRLSPPTAKTRPTMPPRTERTRVSASNCRRSAEVGAPSAARIDISVSRLTSRVSVRLPTFAHAMISTNSRRHEEDHQHRPRLRRQLVLPRRDDHVEAARGRIRLWIRLVQARGDLPQLGLRGFGRLAWSQARVDVGHAMFALPLHRRAHVVIVGFVVDVEVLLALRRIVRAWREHADDLRLLDREIERLADDTRIAAEYALPVGVGEDHHRRRALRLIGLYQQSGRIADRRRASGRSSR